MFLGVAEAQSVFNLKNTGGLDAFIFFFKHYKIR